MTRWMMSPVLYSPWSSRLGLVNALDNQLDPSRCPEFWQLEVSGLMKCNINTDGFL